MKESLLMIPGPCAVSEEVLKAMSQPLVPHYGEDWVREYNDTRDALKPLFGTKEDIFLTVGSGHAGIETAVNTLAGRGEKILVVENGFFGERIAIISQCYGIETVTLKEEWGTPVDPNKVEDVLKKDDKIKAVAVVHGETSTGVLNPVQAIGEITRRFGLPLFVDAVCSIGGTEFHMDEWGVDIGVTASQKGLSAPPGLAIIAVSEKMREFLTARKYSAVGWYLNLNIWREFEENQKEFQPYGITMAVNLVRALKVSLDQIHVEGLAQRFGRHADISKRLRVGLAVMGVESFGCGAPLPLVTAVKCPPGVKSAEIVSYMRKEYQIYISQGLGAYRDNTFRVGHMGLAADTKAVDSFLTAMQTFLKQHKIKCET